MLYVWVILFSCLYCVLTYQQYEENDPCPLPNNQRGICKIISDCPYAQNLLRNGLRPTNCGFSGNDPIVCCTTEADKIEPIQPNIGTLLVVQNSTSNPVSPTLADETVGALSRKKCLVYHPKPEFGIFVTGGKRSLAKEFPHMALIGYGPQDNIQWLCGGSLISNNFVLTAAHCLEARELGPARWIRLGDLDLSTENDDASPQNFTVKARIPHPLYQSPARYHDIALIELDRNVARSAYVSPACLNTKHDLNQTRMTATGWGRKEFSGDSSSFLLKVDLDYVPNEACSQSFGTTSRQLLPDGIKDEWQVCAGGVVGEDTCEGDSGGPLQVKIPERTYLVQVHSIIGVTSFGKACGLSRAPGIYTRVSNYVPWIESVIWPNEDAKTTGPKWTPLN